MESGLRPYEKRALSTSAPSNEHNARPDVVDAQLRLQFLGRILIYRRNEMLPSVMASDPAHDPNTFPVDFGSAEEASCSQHL
jgi:hypothetical protein